MQNPKLTLLAAGALGALAAALSLMGTRPAAGQKGGPPTVDTRVVNTAAQPVPVTLQGTTQIDTTTPIPVRDVNAASRQPYHLTVHRTIPDGGNTANGPLDTIPAGKRLVIEYLSANAGDEAGDTPVIEILTTVNGENGAYFFPFTRQFDNTFVVSQQVRFYCDGGSAPVLVYARRGGTTGAAPAIITISGYLEDM